MGAQQVWAFALASVVIIVVPGVDMALVTRQVVVYGRRAAFGTLAGLLTSGLTHVALATVGLSAVLMASATAYTAVKTVGAMYLVVIGTRTLWAARHRAGHSARANGHADVDTGLAQRPRRPIALRHAYLLGLVSNLTNPKMAVFFLTFLPQFVTPGPHATAQIAHLGLLFNAMASTWWVGYVLGLARISAWLERPAVRRTIERITGTVLVALGVRLATER